MRPPPELLPEALITLCLLKVDANDRLVHQMADGHCLPDSVFCRGGLIKKPKLVFRALERHGLITIARVEKFSDGSVHQVEYVPSPEAHRLFEVYHEWQRTLFMVSKHKRMRCDARA